MRSRSSLVVVCRYGTLIGAATLLVACKGSDVKEASEAAAASASPVRLSLRQRIEQLKNDPELSGARIELLNADNAEELDAASSVENQESPNPAQVLVTLPGKSPLEPEKLRERLKSIQAKVTSASQDPRLGAGVRFEKGIFVGASLWNLEQHRLLSSIAVDAPKTQVILHDKADFQLHFRTRRNCTGTIRNAGAKPLDVKLECVTMDEEQLGKLSTPNFDGQATTLVDSAAIGVVQPGEEKTYSMKLPGTTKAKWLSLRASVDGKPTPMLDLERYDDVSSWMEILGKGDEFGIVHHPEDNHNPPMPIFAVTDTFTGLSDEAKKKAAAAFAKDIRSHFQKYHFVGVVDLVGIYLYPQTGPHFNFKNGTLSVAKD